MNDCGMDGAESNAEGELRLEGAALSELGMNFPQYQPDSLQGKKR